MGMANVFPLEATPEWRATIQNIPIYANQGVPRGMVVFRNVRGEIMGIMTDVAEIQIGADYAAEWKIGR
jgi:hypothetical protein